MINKNIKVIFFDLDDTLLNSSKAQHEAISKFQQKIDEFKNISQNEFINVWNMVTAEQYYKYSIGEVSLSEHRINRMKNLFSNFDINISDKLAENYFIMFSDTYKECWKLFDDTISTLDYLKNKYILAIISNGDSIQQREKIKKTKIEMYFKEIIISSEVNIPKPDKKIFELACTKLDVKPNECIMCGDNFKSDIIGAQNSNMSAIWINRKQEKIEYEHQINNLNDILKII